LYGYQTLSIEIRKSNDQCYSDSEVTDKKKIVYNIQNKFVL